ncbi:D-alanyl-D-alanine carboxypeptidase/D-alanyl-D-alanine-endopeptidase [Skermania sp. ID1734]|uniref:D-alanyl-D-alanine carboxypeptidase/D-alanyl-D-alanine endopeptidase n=1 Tax=Skermania sp. ID1734 TaxID=2597516 RepID=UPI00117E84F2|nr:D-alanyl-D-alanine carboxypeptidase/D-alanyl-D-alanine-endopeptidase [Skermania sp. ID1734]TSD95704.1 D-alanyl-D-alanine carboxypeptidase/D-alanyl-D-alanine-endopeptidase [Skermania sp. ID1734]
MQALVVAIVLLLVGTTGALVLIQHPWRATAALGALTVAPPPALVLPAPQIAPVPATAPEPTAAALSAQLAKVVGNPDLGTFSASVSDALSATTLWSSNPDRPMTPASTTKVLTTAAAILALPLDHRVSTTVVRGSTPDEIVLVGGGDPTLTAQPVGQPSFYPGSARLEDLVQQIKRSGVTPTSIVVDTSAFSGPTMAQGWDNSDIAGGNITPIEPLMIDGGRSNPLVDESPRSPTPALDAGRQLATALGIDPANVRIGSAPSGAAPLASVQSAPLRDRLGQMMRRSDNVLAEEVGREIAKSLGDPLSFDGAVKAVTDTLRDNGFDLSGVTLHDVSGLSVDDRIPPRLLDQVLNEAAGNANPKLRPMLDYLPVAGATGTLADRYGPADRAGAGWVRAKTGTLSVASALVGYVVDNSGRVLTFALMSNDRPPDVSRPALDAIASTLRTCGCT